MFERFTERARHVMVLAQEESRNLDHDHIGTEHVLLGVAHEGQGPAAAVLGRHGLTPEALRLQLLPGMTYGDSAVPFTPGAKRVLERALREALDLRHPEIEPEHLLLALTDDIPDDAPGPGAHSLFKGAGIDPSLVHVELLSMLPRGTGRGRRLGRRERVERLEPVQVPVQATPIGRDLPVTGPVCPVCRAPLPGRLHVAAVTADKLEGVQTTDTLRVLIAYCGACGVALGTVLP